VRCGQVVLRHPSRGQDQKAGPERDAAFTLSRGQPNLSASPIPQATRFLYGPRGPGVAAAASTIAATSSMLQSVLLTPAAIAARRPSSCRSRQRGVFRLEVLWALGSALMRSILTADPSSLLTTFSMHTPAMRAFCLASIARARAAFSASESTRFNFFALGAALGFGVGFGRAGRDAFGMTRTTSLSRPSSLRPRGHKDMDHPEPSLPRPMA
jgi:hypothetical protein